jgi:predicted O-methyltransferase YrrM
VSAHHASVARANLEAAGVASLVDIRVGPAIDSLPKLVEEGAGPFDFVFIDADKPNNANYLDWALRLTRSGSLIVVDNVIRQGHVLLTDGSDANVAGSRAAIELAGHDPRIDATAIQTVGSKGWDGFILGLVR